MVLQRRGTRTPHGRPPANLRCTRVFYNRDAVFHHLRQSCPELLPYFPRGDSFRTLIGENRSQSGDSSPVAMLEIGRAWPASPGSVPHQGEAAILCAWDRNGYDSGAPELVPYGHGGAATYAAHKEWTLVRAHGFNATGVFAELRESRNPRQNPTLDDPHVVAIFQLIMMTRNNRRYYWYGQRHWESAQEHFATLVEALHIVTFRVRQSHACGPQRALASAVMPQQPLSSRLLPPPYRAPHRSPPPLLRRLAVTSGAPSHNSRNNPLATTPSIGQNSALPASTSTGRHRTFPMPPHIESKLRADIERMKYRLMNPRHPNPNLRSNINHIKSLMQANRMRSANSLTQDSVINRDANYQPETMVLGTTEATNEIGGNATVEDETGGNETGGNKTGSNEIRTEGPTHFEAGDDTESPSPPSDDQILHAVQKTKRGESPRGRENHSPP